LQNIPFFGYTKRKQREEVLGGEKGTAKLK
jgi:hypothetical protein